MTPETFFENFAHIAEAPNGVKKLRELILQMAVRGTLVPQDSSDEPAAKLLERIRAEKARLVKEKKIRKADPLPPVAADEVPYALPQGWVWVRHGDIIELVSGQHLQPGEYNESNDGIPYLTGPADFGEKTPIASRWTITPKAVAIQNDILITVKGSGCGKTNILGYETAAISRQLMAVRPILVDRNFCKIALDTNYQLFQDQRTGIAIPGISRDDVLTQIVALPPLSEQQRIVAKVYQLMTLCDELEAKQQRTRVKLTLLNNAALDRLTSACVADDFTVAWHLLCYNFDLLYTTPETIAKLRQSVLQLAVQGKLVEQDPNDEPASVLLAKIKAEKELLVKEKKIRKSAPLSPVTADEAPYSLPKGWQWARFVDIANIASNLVQPETYLDCPHVAPDNIEKFTGKLLPYRSVRDDGVTSSNHLFSRGQIIYSKIRPNLSKVTIVDFDGLCSADMYPVDSYISPRYLLHYILSATFLNMAVKKDTRVAMPKINQEELNRIMVPVCPLAEQKRIVAKVDQLLSLCGSLEARLSEAHAKAEKLAIAAVQGLLKA